MLTASRARKLLFVANRFEERFANGLEMGFEFNRAIAVAARPWFRPVFMPAIFPGVGVFDGEEVKIFFPIRAFLIERSGAETGLDPLGVAGFIDASFAHIVEIFVTGN